MIHRFRVQNFKSIADVTIDLSPVTVLVGRSGTGKSNFVESIRYLRDTLASKHQHEKWVTYQPAARPDARMAFEVEFSIVGIRDRFTYEMGFGAYGPQAAPVVERLALGKKTFFHQSSDDQARQSRWIVEPDLVNLPTPGQIIIGQIPSISEVVIAYTALTSGIGCYVFPDTVLCGGRQNESSIGLNDGATNYLDTLKEIASNLQDLNVRKSIVSALQRVNPSVSSVELNSIQQPSHVVVGHKFNTKTLALQLPQESDGFRRFFAHLLALYQRPPKQTLIFEHPEDGIHPGALALLADEFKVAPEHARGQVILTTHSPILLDHFEADQILVVELKGFETHIGLVSNEQREAIHDNLLDTGELLTVDPARLQPSATATAEI